ncbi:hypothetical protein CK203_055623 [Vitis vinifera]|uniref:Uncharacterized protein n=1 Tax=Vitis vinifera TaxID=29760 RepID=A0A438FV72_VITVI|nr:hypothetical protein CK203_055623 [Vitis vinifera]
MMCGGDFMSKNQEKARDFLSYVAEVSRGWDESNAKEVGRMKSQPNASNAKAGMYTLNEDIDMKEKFAAMARRLEELEVKKIREVHAIFETPMQAIPIQYVIWQHLQFKLEEPSEFHIEAKGISVHATWPSTFASLKSLNKPLSILARSWETLLETKNSINAQLSQRIDNLDKMMDGRQNDLSQKIDNLQYSISRLTNLNTVREVKPMITLRSGKEVDLPTSKSKHELENEAEKEKIEEIKGRGKGTVQRMRT